MSGDQRSVIILGDRQLWRHAGRCDGAPLLVGCREEYHDLQGLIRPGGLAIRSCDPHICIHPDQPSRLVGMRGDFQRKDSACSNLSEQKQPSTASWSRLRPAPRQAVNFKKWSDASLRWRITSRSSRTITRVPCTFRTMTNAAARPWPSGRIRSAVSWGSAHHAMEHLTDDATTGGLRRRRFRGQVAGDSGAAGTDRPVSAQAQE